MPPRHPGSKVASPTSPERVLRGRASPSSTGSITCSLRKTLSPAPPNGDAPDTRVGRPRVVDRQVPIDRQDPVAPSGERSPGGRHITFPAEADSPIFKLKWALKASRLPKAIGDDDSPVTPSTAPTPASASTAPGLRQGSSGLRVAGGTSGTSRPQTSDPTAAELRARLRRPSDPTLVELRQGAARQGSEAKRAPAVQRGPSGVPVQVMDLTASNLQARPPFSDHCMDIITGTKPPE